MSTNLASRAFGDLLHSRWEQGKFVCIGLDIDMEKFPPAISREQEATKRIRMFNSRIVDATADYASAYKLNSAHYERLGSIGSYALELSISDIKKKYPEIPVILDAKRGDIRDTNEYYAQSAFDVLNADAITVHPYMGRISLLPFLSRKDKGVIVMGANTAEGADEIQSLEVQPGNTPLYKAICHRVAETWNANGNCAVTASATDTEQLQTIRNTVGDMPILLLGVGAQGGKLESSIAIGRANNNFGLIINSSRSIIYASSGSNFDIAAGQAARGMNDTIISAYKSDDIQ